jgi:hypothetical protein
MIGAFGLAVLAGFTLQRLREPADAG